MKYQLTTQPLDRAACRQVAELHRQALPQAFLSSLGVAALTEFYAGIQHHPGGVLLTARSEANGGKLLGFVSGVADAAAFQKWLVRRRLPCVSWRLLPTLASQACRPSTWRKVGELLCYPRRVQQAPLNLPPAELLTLAVAEDCRRQGIARALYAALVDEFRRRGVPAFRIMVGGELTSAQQFYTAQGALPAGEWELHAGDPTRVFVQQVLGEVATSAAIASHAAGSQA